MKGRIYAAVIAAVVIVFSLVSPAVSAQVKTASLSGVVKDKADGSPVPYATVILSPSNLFAMTDEKGAFSFSKVTPGDVKVTVEFLGMVKQSHELKLKAGDSACLNFEMEEESFRMEEVTVVATRSEAGASTASKISRQAMDHMQSNSLGDIMGLLPGGVVGTSSLNEAKTITIRSGSGNAANMNSLGAAVIVDGSPLSNNANFQVLAPSQTDGTSAVGGGTSPSTGVDLRTISTDNIESVEVIRGIPSVQYGDITSGAVIVKSRAGLSPLEIRMKANPNTYSVSAAKGFKAGKLGNINLSGDYAYNNSKVTASFKSYHRANVKALLSRQFGQLSTNTTAEFSLTDQVQKPNPDLEASAVSSGSLSLGGRLLTNGHWNIANAGWLKSLDYNLSASYTSKNSFYEENTTNASALYSLSMGNSVVSNVAGMDVYDAQGNKLTGTAPGDENAWATVMPYSYFSHYDINGREVNAFAKVVANFYARFGSKIDNHIMAGVDYKLDGNLGDGLSFPEGTPPMRNISAISSGFRQRRFSDIPLIHQIGAFVQDSYSQKIVRNELNITAGVRFDWVNGKTVLAPRVNASVEIVPKIFTLRGGWGIQAKAPTALYLYPQKAYHDLILFNNLNMSGVDKSEELLVAKTTVYDVENPDLKIATNRKAELGFDLCIADRYTLAVTAYDERISNGYSLGTDLSAWKWVEAQQYKAVDDSYKGTGQRPQIVASGDPIPVWFSFARPLNSSMSHSYGIEYELDLGRFEAIRTSFFLNGAWNCSRSWSNEYSYSTQTPPMDSYKYNVAVYNPGKSAYCSSTLRTSLRVIHNIPSIGFVVSLTAQASLYDKSWTDYDNDLEFEQYLSWKDGQLHSVAEEFGSFDALKADPEFSYMTINKSDMRFIAELYKPYVTFNLNLSKEVGKMATFSFFVNNLFNTRPLYESKKTPGSFTELGTPIFFGFDMKLRIK